MITSLGSADSPSFRLFLKEPRTSYAAGFVLAFGVPVDIWDRVDPRVALVITHRFWRRFEQAARAPSCGQKKSRLVRPADLGQFEAQTRSAHLQSS